MGNKAVTDINGAIIECKRNPEIEVWEREIVRDFGSRLQVVLGEMEKDFEEHKNENPLVRELFVTALALFQSIPSLLPRGIQFSKATEASLMRIWTIGLNFLDSFVKKNKELLTVHSWSLGANVGFPIGVSAMFAVTFK